MDKLDEIRQHCEGGGPIRRIDMKYLLSEVDRLNDVITSIRNYETESEKQVSRDTEQIKELIDERDELTARAEAAEAERDAAVEDLKQQILWNGTACAYCRYCEEAESALSPCDTCEDIPDTKMPTNWEWCGPQAGKGAAE